MKEEINWQQFNAEHFAELDPVLRGQAVEMLRKEIPELDKLRIRKAMEKNPDTWWAPYHMFWGMGIRNLLRKKGFGEEEFGVGNMDDYYISIVEAAVNA